MLASYVNNSQCFIRTCHKESFILLALVLVKCSIKDVGQLLNLDIIDCVFLCVCGEVLNKCVCRVLSFSDNCCSFQFRTIKLCTPGALWGVLMMTEVYTGNCSQETIIMVAQQILNAKNSENFPCPQLNL